MRRCPLLGFEGRVSCVLSLFPFHCPPLRRRSRASDCLRTPNRWASPVLSGRAGYPPIGPTKMCTDYRWRMPPSSTPLSILSMRRACPPGRAYALPLRRAGDSWGARQVPISRRARRTKRSKDGAARRDEQGTASVRQDATQGTAAKAKAKACSPQRTSSARR